MRLRVCQPRLCGTGPPSPRQAPLQGQAAGSLALWSQPQDGRRRVGARASSFLVLDSRPQTSLSAGTVTKEAG